MRISDWSSDVCSSDLPGSRQSFRYPRRDDRRSCHELERHRKTGEVARAEDKRSGIRARTGSRTRPAGSAGRNVTRVRWLFAQRAGDPHPSLSSRNTTLSRQLNFRVADNPNGEDRKSVRSGKSVSVRVKPGGRRIIKKKKKKKR